jgi:hypothetical protein
MNRAFRIACAVFACGCGSTTSVEAGSDATSDNPTSHAGADPDGTTGDGSSDMDGGTDGGGGADGAGGGGDAPRGGDAPTGDDAMSGWDAMTGADATTGDAAFAMDGGGSDVLTADGACKCQPYWCGCGPCGAGQIACTVDRPACARGCLSSCPELQQVTCGCDQGRCVRSGVDASVACFIDQDCPAGDCCAHVGSSASDIASGTCTMAPNTCCGAGCP